MSGLTIGLLTALGLALVVIGVLSFYVMKLARIIFVFEDDLSFALDELTECEEQMTKVVSLQLFFDSLETRQEFQKSIDTVKLCRVAILRLAERFLERSKQRYVYEDASAPREGSLEYEMIMKQFEDQEKELMGINNDLESSDNNNRNVVRSKPGQELMFMRRDGQAIRMK